MIKRFNLRAYGLLIRDEKLLISSEQYEGHHLMKFPGGGVEYGEGVKDALLREWQEEMKTRIEIGELIYVTDYFLQSAFREEDQIISFYYQVFTDELVLKKKHEHELIWIGLETDQSETFTFPQEQKVFDLIQKRFRQ